MKKLLFFISLIVFLSFLGICFAQRPLEVQYPAIQGYEITTTTVSFGHYIKYVYFFVIGISGFIGLGVLIWAGFQYLTSAGNPEKMRDAKDWITRCLIGLIILFLSWIIAYTINPQLTYLKTKPLIPFVTDLPRGVLLCEKQVDIPGAWNDFQAFKNTDPGNTEERERIKESYTEKMEEIIPNCISRIGAATGFRKDFRYLYLVPAGDKKYGALIFEKDGFGGKMQMFMPNRDSNPVEKQINLSNTASMYSFALNQHPDPSWSVTLYAEENSNYLVDAPCMKYTAGSSADSGKCQTTNISWIQSIGISPKYSVVNDLQGKSPESLEIEGDLLVVLIKDPSATATDPGQYVVKKENDPSLLNDDPITELRPSIKKGLEPVASTQSMIIVAYSTDLTTPD